MSVSVRAVDGAVVEQLRIAAHAGLAVEVPARGAGGGGRRWGQEAVVLMAVVLMTVEVVGGVLGSALEGRGQRRAIVLQVTVRLGEQGRGEVTGGQ